MTAMTGHDAHLVSAVTELPLNGPTSKARSPPEHPVSDHPALCHTA
jgi:hypothetical protein